MYMYRGFEPRLGQTKDYKIGICCFSISITEKEQTLVGSELEWGDMSFRKLMFQ